MSVEQNQAMVHRLIHRLFNQRDLAVAGEIVSPNYVNHDPLTGEAAGRDGLRQLSDSLRSAFPDGHFTINEQFDQGDRVVTRWAFWGTQFGEFAGVPGSGKGVWLTGIWIHRVAGGLIQEGWTGFERAKWDSSEGTAGSVIASLCTAGPKQRHL
jgi:steroid delta-isomerase-like uncharacterized protein